MNLSQLKQAIGHGWRPHPGPCETGDHGGEIVSPIEAVLELGEVARYVVGADGPIGAGDRRLDIAERRVGPLEGGRARREGSAACDDDLMRTSGLVATTEAAQTIADHRAVGREAGFGETCDRMCAEACHTAQLDANRLFV